MRNTKRAVWLVVVMAIVCALTLAVALPASADENANVAKIGDTEYETLAAAIEAANDGDTHDCTLANGKQLANSEVTHDAAVAVEMNGVTYFFSDLQGAFDFAKKGATVKLLSDITLTEQVNILTALDGLTLDGDGHTIVCATTTDPLKSGGSALYFGNASDKKYCTGIAIKNLTMTGTARFAIFLCGGTSTTFENVKISGKWYIGVNLYGTHGAVMTDCEITNETAGSDEYISAVWANVAADNPLKLVNTKVSSIAINTYTTANKLAPKIFVDAASEVGEIHTFDDGSVSGDKRLCVSTESEGTYVLKEYDNGSWVDIRVAKITDADGGVTYFGTLAEAFAAAKAGDVVKLLNYTNENVTVKAGQQITLDLNGKTLNGGTGTAVATITNYGTLTIKDSVGGGRVMRDDSGIEGETSYYVIRNVAGTLTIESGTIYNNSGYKKTNPSGSMVGSSLICNGGTDDKAYLYIKGGTITQKNFIAIKNDANGILEVTGGEISSDHSAIQNWFKATITGGKITGQLWTDSWEEGSSVGETVIGGDAEYTGEIVIDITGEIAPALKITGGTLNITKMRITTAATKYGAKPAVSGGVFNIEIEDEWCVDGFIPKANDDGTYGVEQLLKIVATEGVLGENIKFYILTNRYGDLKFRIRVTINGEEVIYEGVDYEKNGVEYYAYILDLPPQYLDTTLKIELINNEDMTVQTVSYSFFEYCKAVIEADENAKQLVADLLWYSVAAKDKCEIDSADLSKKLKNLGLVQSTGEIKATVEKSHTKDGEEAFISGATLYHDSVNRIIVLVEISLYKNTVANHTYTYRKADGTAQDLVKIGELETDGPTYVMLATEGIYANEFDTGYTIEISFDGTVVETLVYSVNNYCKTKAASNELAKALYYYGESAKAYKNS